eukprot:13773015-Ditylum_brightwellii.AAC.1
MYDGNGNNVDNYGGMPPLAETSSYMNDADKEIDHEEKIDHEECIDCIDTNDEENDKTENQVSEIPVKK